MPRQPLSILNGVILHNGRSEWRSEYSCTSCRRVLKEVTEYSRCEKRREHSRISKKDIDILWTHRNNDEIDSTSIEVKGDRWFKTGNFFFETISNKTKGTLGCFLYTEANYVYYFFTEPKRLYILPMPETKTWFVSNMESFKEKETSTPTKNGHYITVGKLVPRDVVVENVRGVEIIDLAGQD